jgi:hypothetical protein
MLPTKYDVDINKSSYLNNKIVRSCLQSLEHDSTTQITDEAVVSPEEFNHLASKVDFKPQRPGERVRKQIFVVKPVCIDPNSRVQDNGDIDNTQKPRKLTKI